MPIVNVIVAPLIMTNKFDRVPFKNKRKIVFSNTNIILHIFFIISSSHLKKYGLAAYLLTWRSLQLTLLNLRLM